MWLMSANLNEAIDAISVILPIVMSSAAEMELAGKFTNAKYAVATRSTRADLGQSATTILIDNAERGPEPWMRWD